MPLISSLGKRARLSQVYIVLIQPGLHSENLSQKTKNPNPDSGLTPGGVCDRPSFSFAEEEAQLSRSVTVSRACRHQLAGFDTQNQIPSPRGESGEEGAVGVWLSVSCHVIVSAVHFPQLL